MSAIIARSICILSHAGLGMAMFCLGLYISDTALFNASVAVSCIAASTKLSHFLGLFIADAEVRFGTFGTLRIKMLR
jgi:hypothetical protein